MGQNRPFRKVYYSLAKSIAYRDGHRFESHPSRPNKSAILDSYMVFVSLIIYGFLKIHQKPPETEISEF
jgi:hypothetical protein